MGCLLATDLVERDVGLALEALFGIPGRAPVPPEDDAPGLHEDESSAPWPIVTEAGSAMTGQSFHSRSMA